MGHDGHGQRPAYVPDPRDETGIDPDIVNAQRHFSLQSVFRSGLPLPSEGRGALVENLLEALQSTGVTIRGWYDVAGFRADADLLFWALADSPEKLQAAYHEIVRSQLGAHLEPVWSAMATHTPAEFNARHLPACFGGVAPRPYVAVYPFIRSWDWYYLPQSRRSAMLREHGMNGAGHMDVKVSTLSAFALGDYEWTIALEADSIERIMSVLRKQRESEARLFVREDTPFFTGPRVELHEWAQRQASYADSGCECGQECCNGEKAL
ncbi:chlorite dismutase family protein [Schaalia sp. ZJ405]|nr:chlorite dismutase family protein [Schaalia sp. ZJ405]